jgi:hypothetical protein
MEVKCFLPINVHTYHHAPHTYIHMYIYTKPYSRMHSSLQNPLVWSISQILAFCNRHQECEYFWVNVVIKNKHDVGAHNLFVISNIYKELS